MLDPTGELGITARSVRTEIKKGNIRTIIVGRRILISHSEAGRISRGDDVAPIPENEPIPEEDPAEVVTDEEPVRPRSFGDRIYFIQLGTNGPIKIGCSRNPPNRLRTLQTSHPLEILRLLGHFRGGPQVERGLHQTFASDRIRGEWFVCSPKLLKFIETTITVGPEF